jgi:protein-S-isoprenylcysteine O-methyltransferase Ste14
VFWLVSAAWAKPGGSRPLRARVVNLLPLVTVGVLARVAGGRNVVLHALALHVVGAALVALGLGLAVWARFVLGANWGMPMTTKDEPELVTAGPYRYVRHPIYTGFISAGLGSGLAAGVYWFVVFGVMTLYFSYSAVREEQLLTETFPREYPEYKARTKMLIPYLF